MPNHTLSINKTLDALLALGAENEVVEFKEAKNGYDFTKLDKYFSALCNEANLKHQARAWLVFGVNDARQVVGSQFRAQRRDLDSLKAEIAPTWAVLYPVMLSVWCEKMHQKNIIAIAF